jgi:hypothetical protein
MERKDYKRYSREFKLRDVLRDICSTASSYPLYLGSMSIRVEPNGRHRKTRHNEYCPSKSGNHQRGSRCIDLIASMPQPQCHFIYVLRKPDQYQCNE